MKEYVEHKDSNQLYKKAEKWCQQSEPRTTRNRFAGPEHALLTSIPSNAIGRVVGFKVKGQAYNDAEIYLKHGNGQKGCQQRRRLRGVGGKGEHLKSFLRFH